MTRMPGSLAPLVFPSFADERGKLIAVDLAVQIPFEITRVFWIFDVPVGCSRAGHAHKTCSQFLVCGNGAVTLAIENAGGRTEIALNAGGAVLIPPLNFLDLTFETECSFVIVFCDKPYDAEDYIYEKPACL